MNNGAFIKKLASITGTSRKQVIDTLEQMRAMPEVQNKLKVK